MSAPARVPPSAPPPAPRGTPGLVRGITLLGAVALVVGNMVGTSIYTLPASLAATAGPLGLLSWLVTAALYLCVALVYASLGTRFPRTGGPYVYVREAFGDFAAFQTVWVYWVSAVIGNAGIALGVVGYVEGFVPAVAASPLLRFALAQAMVWGLCALNVRGVRWGTRLQIAVLFLNVGPLLAISLVSLRAFDAANLVPFAPFGWKALATGTALIVWAYSGVESAAVPAEEVTEPATTIARGTMLGYALGTAVFLLTALAVAGVLPNAEAASSARPIAMAAERAIGPWAGLVIGAGAVIAGLGTLNGWILMSGRIPLTAAADGLFPRALAAVHPRWGTPHVALTVGSAVAAAMLLLVFDRTLLQAFEFIVLLAVWTTLVPHLYAAAAELVLSRRHPDRWPPAARRRARWVASLAFLAVMFLLYGAGAEVARWGFLVMVAGTPIYVALRGPRGAER